MKNLHQWIDRLASATKRPREDDARGRKRVGWEGRSVQHPATNAATKSKKSWELTVSSLLKSALGRPAKNALRKSKKSCEFRTRSPLKSARHGFPWQSSGIPSLLASAL